MLSKTILLLILTLYFIPWAYTQESIKYIPNLSGLAWIEGDLFLGIHDIKNNPELDTIPRISLITIPGIHLDRIKYLPINLKFSEDLQLPSDLESISKLPDDQGFLLCESGQSWDGSKRIFHVVYNDSTFEIIDYADWPVAVTNVEATEVFNVNDHLVFIYAERSESFDHTYVRWCKMSLNPLKFGPFSEIKHKSKYPVGLYSRPIVAMDIDNEGFIYIATSYDPGSDTGPFGSTIWQIGQVLINKNGEFFVKLKKSKWLGTLDGLKVESLAIRQYPGGEKEIFFGTDDEFYGGVIRLLP
jgi:hypothetical protein